MAKFKFYQDKEVTTWVRDYYYVEAETLEDAIALVEDAGTSLEELECTDKRVQFDEREWDLTTADCLMQIILFDEIIYG